MLCRAGGLVRSIGRYHCRRRRRGRPLRHLYAVDVVGVVIVFVLDSCVFVFDFVFFLVFVCVCVLDGCDFVCVFVFLKAKNSTKWNALSKYLVGETPYEILGVPRVSLRVPSGTPWIVQEMKVLVLPGKTEETVGAPDAPLGSLERRPDQMFGRKLHFTW